MTRDWQGQTYSAFQFGDSPSLADELAGLVVSGRKTATCCSAIDADVGTPGERQIVLDGAGEAVALIEITAVDDVHFDQVTEDMAAAEGEGDLSLAYWRAAHEAFFRREGTFSPDMALKFERFRLVEALAQQQETGHG